MQTFIFSFILLLIGCGSSSTDNVAPCIIGTFGSNTPLSAFSADDIKVSKISDLEKQLIFKEDGTGYYIVPTVKNQFPEFKVEFAYKYNNNMIDITATKLYSNGKALPNDMFGKDDLLLYYLKFYKLFASLNERTTCNCSKTGIETAIVKTADNTDFINSNDPIFSGNRFQDIKNWVKRN